MKSIEESVVQAMDGTDPELFNYLPFILQDIWEIGASPQAILNLIKKHKQHNGKLKILDLGCGKGAVSISLAMELNCNCYGVDALKEFIEDARIKAKEYCVEKYCRFESGDIRLKAFEEQNYDIIILGALGPVFGNYFETLTKLKKYLAEDGLIIIDDGYQPDSNNSNIISKSGIMDQAGKAGMKLIDEDIALKNEIKVSNKIIFTKIKKRCGELIIKEPNKKYLFEAYIQNQINENRILEEEIICSTMVFAAI